MLHVYYFELKASNFGVHCNSTFGDFKNKQFVCSFGSVVRRHEVIIITISKNLFRVKKSIFLTSGIAERIF